MRFYCNPDAVYWRKMRTFEGPRRFPENREKYCTCVLNFLKKQLHPDSACQN